MDKFSQCHDEVETPGGLNEMQKRIERQRKKDSGETEVKPKDVFEGFKQAPKKRARRRRR